MKKMKYIKLYEDYHNDIAKSYISLSKNYNCELAEINKGFCDEISFDVIKNVVGEHNYVNVDEIPLSEIRVDIVYEIDDGSFWSDDKRSPYKYEGGYWQLDRLDYFGKLPFKKNVLNTFYLDGHVWVYYNGKHYDAEVPFGVDSFWDLPIYQRQLKKLHIIE
jgi:hypothetical protein